jgi:molecular chaperone DnaJ
MTRDYYLILGIDTGVGPDEVKRAYHRKALELHPDHYGDDPGPFLEVQEAYAVLSNPTRREQYDRNARLRGLFRSTRAGPARRPEHAGSRVGPVGAVKTPINLGEVSVSRSFETFHPSFDEILDRLRANFTGAARPKSEHIESLAIDVHVAHEHALTGGQARIMVPSEIDCPACQRCGAVGRFMCWHCAGQGRITGEFPVTVTFPPGMIHGHTVIVPLTELGIRNLYLTVRFRVT